MRTLFCALGAVAPFIILLPHAPRAVASPCGDDPFADVVVSFDAGQGGAKGYDNPFTTLGSPERFTGEGLFPVVVSPFSPPFGQDEIVSIGAGGHLTVRFNTPVRNSPGNPWGIDLLIFGNTGFIDSNWPNGVVGGLFGNDGGVIEVSRNGKTWFRVPNVTADNMFPTLGYLDSGPYDDQPGTLPTDFTRPVDPALTLNDFMGRSYAEVLALYDGSGGGTGIDLDSVGLNWIRYVRVLNEGTDSIEIDAFADVRAIPAPGAAGLILLGLPRRRRRTQ